MNIETTLLWTNGAPAAIGTDDADKPSLTLYRPEGAATQSPVIIVCPGGGYGHLADHEGAPIARWLNSLGVIGAVLRYRHAPRYRHPAPLSDAARAARMLRARATEWKLAPNRVGILGFSAGGHLAATLSTHFDKGNPGSSDPVERMSSRPDVAVLLYPVITLAGPTAHAGSRGNLLGDTPSPSLVESLCVERRVSALTPPTFLFHTVNDEAVPVENSLAYATALGAANIPFEMHLYESGPHGVGLAEQDPVLGTWPARCAAWLAGKGFASI